MIGIVVLVALIILTIYLIIWVVQYIRLKGVDFSHLTVHYSQKGDMPNKSNLAKPRYIVNNITKVAFWVSTPVDKYLNSGKIQWHTHDGKEALLKSFKDNNIDIIERDPTNAELGLKR